MLLSMERALVILLACWAPPAQAWHEADDLETCETICAERKLSAAKRADTEAEEIVIDLDQLGRGKQSVDAGDGLTLELEHRLPNELWVLVEEEIDLCEVPIPSEIDLRPVPMGSSHEEAPGFLASDELSVTIEEETSPLPLSDPGRRDAQTATFQQAYAKMMAAGRKEEAEGLAVEFLTSERESAHDRHSVVKDSQTSEHRVGYRPASGRWVRQYSGNASARWSEVYHRQITVRFDETPLDELARFLRWATGMTVEVELPADRAEKVRCHVQCNDLTIAEAMEAIGRQTGLRIVAEEERLLIFAE